MAAPYDLNDDSVVVIIGSGAGGGTLGNELAQKGIEVVILEAGGRASKIEDFVNDEWASFSQLAWLDKRTTSGTWRVCQGFPEPAGLDRQGGRRLDHALGRRLAALPGARVQGEDRTMATSPARTCSTGR